MGLSDGENPASACCGFAAFRSKLLNVGLRPKADDRDDGACDC